MSLHYHFLFLERAFCVSDILITGFHFQSEYEFDFHVTKLFTYMCNITSSFATPMTKIVSEVTVTQAKWLFMVRDGRATVHSVISRQVSNKYIQNRIRYTHKLRWFEK